MMKCTVGGFFFGEAPRGWRTINIGLNLREVFQNRLVQRFADFLVDAADIGTSISFSCECSLSLSEWGHESAVTLHHDPEKG
jgi:hypothetical protein